MSIVTFEKPVTRVAETDWYYKISELKESCNDHRRNVFELRNESHQIRNNTDITTYWNTHHTNSAILNRRNEIIRWKYQIEILYKDLEKEIEDIKNDKKKTEEVLDHLNLNFTVTNHCLSIRDERGGADFCYDIASAELNTEQLTLENLKKMLTEICQVAWEQINELEELRINVEEDLNNKNNTICIDTRLLGMTKDSTNISLKPDPLRFPEHFGTYEKWLQQCNNIKQSIQKKLTSSKKLRETMFLPRNKARNDLRGQNGRVNYALRRRIYDTDKLKYELEWQKSNILADKEKFLKEIENLENALDKKLYSKKLVETRCEERLYRIGAELCLDKTTIELHKEQLELDNTIQILTNKLNQTKDKHNILVELVNAVEEELKHKAHTLEVDRKCLEYRIQLLDQKESIS